METTVLAMDSRGRLPYEAVWTTEALALADARQVKATDPRLTVWILNDNTPHSGREVK